MDMYAGDEESLKITITVTVGDGSWRVGDVNLYDTQSAVYGSGLENQRAP